MRTFHKNEISYFEALSKIIFASASLKDDTLKLCSNDTSIANYLLPTQKNVQNGEKNVVVSNLS
jgi:hypothetical protein